MTDRLHIRPYTSADAAWVTAHAGPVGGTRVVSRGVQHDLRQLPGVIAERDAGPCGFAFYCAAGDGCELVAIAATEQWCGIGTALLAAVEEAVRAVGNGRLWLITTNDNVDAIRFYQRRGYRIAAVHRAAVDMSREIKPTIPEIGAYGIPIHDEIKLAKAVT